MLRNLHSSSTVYRCSSTVYRCRHANVPSETLTAVLINPVTSPENISTLSFSMVTTPGKGGTDQKRTKGGEKKKRARVKEQENTLLSVIVKKGYLFASIRVRMVDLTFGFIDSYINRLIKRAKNRVNFLELEKQEDQNYTCIYTVVEW